VGEVCEIPAKRSTKNAGLLTRHLLNSWKALLSDGCGRRDRRRSTCRNHHNSGGYRGVGEVIHVGQADFDQGEDREDIVEDRQEAGGRCGPDDGDEEGQNDRASHTSIVNAFADGEAKAEIAGVVVAALGGDQVVDDRQTSQCERNELTEGQDQRPEASDVSVGHDDRDENQNADDAGIGIVVGARLKERDEFHTKLPKINETFVGFG
jgi:hypothetical protein